MIEIVRKTRDYVIVNKPAGMPSQPDPSGGVDAMAATSELLRTMGERNALWLVHRLDRVVGGLLVFARTAHAAAELSAAFAGEGVKKEYIAVAEGTPEAGTYVDVIYKDARAGKAFIVGRERRGAKKAELYCEPLSTKDARTLVRVVLKTGRFHQIRVQLASRGTPLVGDGKYGSRDKGSRMPALFASRLSFTFGGENITASALPDVTGYPWSLFDKENFEKVLIE